MDCRLPGSSVHGLLQARVLDWVSMPFSMGSSQPGDQTQVSRVASRFVTIWGTQFSSVAQLCLTLCNAMDCSMPGFPVHHQLSACSNSCPLSWWCHPTVSSSVIPFYSCLQSFRASGSFPVSQFLTSCGQTIGASASATVLPMNIQDWLPLGLTGLISLQSKGLSSVLSNTTVQKPHFFNAQLTL